MTVYTTPELPALAGTDAQIAYAQDIRAAQIAVIASPTFRDRVYEAMARRISASRTSGMDTVRRHAATVDPAIQETIDAILSARQAKNVIENERTKGTIIQRVASGAARRLGWT